MFVALYFLAMSIVGLAMVLSSSFVWTGSAIFLVCFVVSMYQFFRYMEDCEWMLE